MVVVPGNPRKSVSSKELEGKISIYILSAKEFSLNRRTDLWKHFQLLFDQDYKYHRNHTTIPHSLAKSTRMVYERTPKMMLRKKKKRKSPAEQHNINIWWREISAVFEIIITLFLFLGFSFTGKCIGFGVSWYMMVRLGKFGQLQGHSCVYHDWNRSWEFSIFLWSTEAHDILNSKDTESFRWMSHHNNAIIYIFVIFPAMRYIKKEQPNIKRREKTRPRIESSKMYQSGNNNQEKRIWNEKKGREYEFHNKILIPR